MDFDSILIEELIDIRKKAREDKDWNLSDDIRNYLDTKLVYIFDSKFGQEVYYCTDLYFNKEYKYIDKSGVTITETKMDKIARIHNVVFLNNRKFLEWNIQNDIRCNNNFDSWIYSMQKGLI